MISLCSNSHKEVYSSYDVNLSIKNALISNGLNKNEIVLSPLSDGGDGLFETYKWYVKTHENLITIKDPLNRIIKVKYLFDPISKTAILDGSLIAGLRLIPLNKRDILNSWSFGVGQSIIQAKNNGAKEIVIGMGGSALGDAGIGALLELGAEIKTPKGSLSPNFSHSIKILNEISSIDLRPVKSFLGKTKIRFLSDVNNKFVGRNGAARIFGPQKGASPDTVLLMENNNKHLTGLILEKYNFNLDQPGYGAAGGLGSIFSILTTVSVENGTDFFLRLSNFLKKTSQSNIIITGEGRYDKTSLFDKLPNAIANRCFPLRKNVKVLGIFGSVIDINPCNHGFDGFGTFFEEKQNPKRSIDFYKTNFEKGVYNATKKILNLIL